MVPDQEEMARANLRLSSSLIFRDAKVEEYKAQVLNGEPEIVENARVTAVAAFEAWLDAIRANMRVLKRSWGLGPDETA